jgi:hypothetical protein
MRQIVDRISPERDVAKLNTNIPRSLASAIPDPILYEHGLVGECNDLIFGFSLVDYATAKGLPEGAVPKIIRICIEEIDKRGLETEGIYRVSGRHALVQAVSNIIQELRKLTFKQLQHEIERDEASFHFYPKDDVYAVASLLKLYLRELPEPVFKFSLQDRIQHTEDRDEHIANNFMLLRSKMRRLPPVHQATLKAIFEHLARIASRSDKNKMDPKNLAIVFGSVIFGEDEIPKDGINLLTVQTVKDTLMEDLIVHTHRLYDHEAPHSSPPLPPTPAGEAVAEVTYGTKRTKITTIPPEGLIPLSPPLSPPQDFTPRLPARPNNSIHPSSRMLTGSPTKLRAEKGLSRSTFPDMPSEERLSIDRASPTTPTDQSSIMTSDTLEKVNSITFPVQEGSSPPPIMRKSSKDFAHDPADTQDNK